MALSVLVALMMLAVPLASSSNLFVDGGQTNSNGDAPSLGAASYDITFKLNADDKSLDQPKLYNNALPTTPTGVTWYLDEDGNLHAIVPKDTTLGSVINALYHDVSGKYVSSVEKDGYTLDVWKNESDGAVYKHNATADGTPIKSNMIFSAQWLLNDDYCEIPVIVDYKGETKEYVKAYSYLAGSNDKKIVVPEAGLLTDGISDIDTYGIIVNAKVSDEIKPTIEKVYKPKATYTDGKEFEFTGESLTATISADSKITIKYTFNNDKYSEIVVSSIAFKDGKDVTLYADKIRSYSYVDVYKALVSSFSDNANKDKLANLPILALAKDKENPSTLIEDLTEDGYKLTGWNEGAQLLKSENNASSPLTLDAKLNGYYVIFMSKGQYEYVYVPFGELSADKTTLDIAGVNHWVWMKYSDYKAGTFTTTGDSLTVQPFNFASTSDKDLVEAEANGKVPAAVLIACFTPTSSTSYAVFDANSYTYKTPTESEYTAGKAVPTDNPMAGTFGNEYVQYLVLPGKVGDKISLPSVEPVYGEDLKVVFISWDRFPASVGREDVSLTEAPDYRYYVNKLPYSEKDVYGDLNAVAQYSANSVDYKYTITFYDGDKVVGVFYYRTAPTTNMASGLAAFETDGKAYEYPITSEDASKACESIITPDKAGYYITQWNDADKNKVIEFKWKDGKLDDIKTDVKDMKDDLNLYAQFKAEKYDIEYTNTYGNVGSMTQTASVDEAVKLYSDSTFVYNGYKLTGWSDRPDGEGNKYDLGASFTLNGEQFEDLKDGKFTLYAVWESTGSVTPGGNTGGDDNNNTDTYLLAGILAVIIILIILIAFLMKRKN